MIFLKHHNSNALMLSKGSVTNIWWNDTVFLLTASMSLGCSPPVFHSAVGELVLLLVQKLKQHCFV